MTVDYPWIEGQAYEVTLLTATGAHVDHAIDAAAESPDADLGFYGLMALIGLYVGVIPVAIGMLWLPWVRTMDARWMRFILAFTVGLLDLPRDRRAARGHRARGGGGPGPRRRRTGVARRGGGLPGAGRRGRVAQRAPRPRGGASGEAALGERAAFLVALGIGLHNLGEGLAIGSAYAVGSLALGAALVVGFALHNTTEGLAIVAPVARSGRVADAHAGPARACSRARRRSSAPGSGPRRSTPAWPRSCSASARARSPR